MGLPPNFIITHGIWYLHISKYYFIKYWTLVIFPNRGVLGYSYNGITRLTIEYTHMLDREIFREGQFWNPTLHIVNSNGLFGQTENTNKISLNAYLLTFSDEINLYHAQPSGFNAFVYLSWQIVGIGVMTGYASNLCTSPGRR